MSMEEVKQYFQNTVAPALTEALTAMWTAQPTDPKAFLANFLNKQSGENQAKPVVYIVYYSMYGHVRRLVEKEKEGIERAGCECRVWQVPETLPQDVLAKMQAKERNDDPIIKPSQLKDADGIIFGFPARFGMMCAQMKAFFDATGQQWQSMALIGKPVAILTSTAAQGGGQETAIMTAITQLAHHGMIFVPLGYSSPDMFNVDEVHGGGPFGATTYAGSDASRLPTAVESNLAMHQGLHFGQTVKRLKYGENSFK